MGIRLGKGYLNRANKYLEPKENLTDRARELHYADIEHEFWHNGYDGFIENMASDTRKSQIVAEAAGDDAKKTKLLIEAAIKQAGGNRLSHKSWRMRFGNVVLTPSHRQFATLLPALSNCRRLKT